MDIDGNLKSVANQFKLNDDLQLLESMFETEGCCLVWKLMFVRGPALHE